MWFYSRVGAIKMGGFTVGYINNLYIEDEEWSKAKPVFDKEATLTAVGRGGCWSFFVVWTVFLFFFFLYPHVIMEWFCFCFIPAWS